MSRKSIFTLVLLGLGFSLSLALTRAQELPRLLVDPTPQDSRTWRVVNWAPLLVQVAGSKGGKVVPVVIGGRQGFRIKKANSEVWHTLFFKIRAEELAIWNSKTKMTVRQTHGRLVIFSPEVGTPLLVLENRNLGKASAPVLEQWINNQEAELLTQITAYLQVPRRDLDQAVVKIYPATGSAKSAWNRERAQGQVQSMFVRPAPLLTAVHIQGFEPMGKGLLLTLTPEGLKRLKDYRKGHPKHFYLIRLGHSMLVAGRFQPPLNQDRLAAKGLMDPWDVLSLHTWLWVHRGQAPLKKKTTGDKKVGHPQI